MKEKKEYVKRLKAAKLEKVPLDMINKYRLTVDSLNKQSYNILNLKLEKYKSKSMQIIAKIDTLSPLKTLTRGYSVTETEDGKVVKSIKDVSKSDKLNIRLTDGNIKVVVE